MSDLVFDPYDHALQDDPYPIYARLRDEAPLYHNEEHDFWVLSRHADVHEAFRSDGVYSNAMGVTLDASAWTRHAHTTMSFLAMDPPEQTRLRKLVSRGFTPARVADLEPAVQRIADHYLDLALERPEFDWIADFAAKLPMDVISELLGVPEADRDEVRRLADLLVHREHGLRDIPQAGMEAAMELFAYYADLLAYRKTNPGEDLISALLNVTDGSDRMTDQEVTGFLFLMVVAGNETTTKLLGNAMFHLTAHPDQLTAVFADESLVEPWIEEALRYDTSTQLLARHLLQDVSLHGVTAPAGSKLALCLGAANHDERVFTDPKRFDIHRGKAEIARSVSFGGGRHFCLGANLARLESRVALTTLVQKVASIEVDREACVRFYSANVRGFANMPVRVVRR